MENSCGSFAGTPPSYSRKKKTPKSGVYHLVTCGSFSQARRSKDCAPSSTKDTTVQQIVSAPRSPHQKNAAPRAARTLFERFFSSQSRVVRCLRHTVQYLEKRLFVTGSMCRQGGRHSRGWTAIGAACLRMQDRSLHPQTPRSHLCLFLAQVLQRSRSL